MRTAADIKKDLQNWERKVTATTIQQRTDASHLEEATKLFVRDQITAEDFQKRLKAFEETNSRLQLLRGRLAFVENEMRRHTAVSHWKTKPRTIGEGNNEK